MRYIKLGSVMCAGLMILAGMQLAATATQPTRATKASIAWGRCSNHALRRAHVECATIDVPLNFAKPNGPTISLAISRLKHTSSASRYEGVMIMNFGGPGLTGLDTPLSSKVFPHIAGRYDWIGLDPRGVGESQPQLSCDPTYFVGPRPRYAGKPTPLAHRWLRRAAQYTDDCASSAGSALLKYDSTVDWAHDLESVRRALGVDQINFYGFSYGTYLGQVYSTLFPQHVNRMILDSNIDPRGDGLHLLLAMATPVQRNLGFWFHWLARRDNRYHLGTTAASVRHLFHHTQAALRKHPAGGVVGPAEWVDVFFLTAFTAPDLWWPYLGGVFRGWALHHHAAPLVNAYSSWAEDTTSDSYYATFVSVRCMDSAWPSKWSTWRKRTTRVSKTAPFVTWGNAWYVMPCRTWPYSVSHRVNVNGHGVRALILGDQFDGSIAFGANMAVRQRFPNARLVKVRKGLAHADSFTNVCEKRLINRYLATGWLPPRRSGRHADVICAANPQPTLGAR